jgi:hypothetical protein
VVLGRCSVEVRILAAHQWLAEPVELALEMLAAHVTPNHPEVAALMSKVADRLGVATGTGSIEGYQSGPDRVDAIVRAVYECLQDSRVRYSEPPASWADQGQKVRTPGEVLETRIGTCLDLAVLMAAALEQAGIRPLLWVVEGHAFLGYWRDELSLGAAAVTETANVVNRVDLHQIGLVETTALTERPTDITFEDAQHAAREHLTRGAKSVGVTDVYQARRTQILPLPARTRDHDGTSRVSHYTPPSERLVAAPPIVGTSQSQQHDSTRTGAEPPRVTRWKNALLDLSLRNKLINYTPRAGLSLAVPGEHLGHLEDVLHAGHAVTLRASDDIAAVDASRGARSGRDLPAAHRAQLLIDRRTAFVDLTEQVYTKRLRALAYRARTIVEETGANNLYLSLGSLVWDIDGRPLRSPLILVPVVLRSMTRGGSYRLVLDEAGSSTPNFCLLEKLRQLHGMTIPGLAEPVTDDSGIDLDAALDAARRAMAERGLGYRVEPTADLAILQFAKYRLWKDLDENWAEFTSNALVKHLIHTPADEFADPTGEPADVDLDQVAELCPISADASQLRAVQEAVSGRTFVLEGPPGTGKSQTITNLLAAAVAEGKRVLFVAEKRAALDVVRQRLAGVGLGPLSLDLHDKGSKPGAVREQIKQALDHAVQVDENGLAAQLGELRSARRRLNRYATRLHEQNRAAQSLYSARDAELAVGAEVAELPITEGFLSSTSSAGVERLRQLMHDLPDLTEEARPSAGHPWAFIDRVESPLDVSGVLSTARELDAALAGLAGRPPVDEMLRLAEWPDDLRMLAELFNVRPAVPLLEEVRTAPWNAAADETLRRLAEFSAQAHPGLDLVTPEFLALPLAEIDGAARTAAASGFFGRKKRLAAVGERLQPVLRDGVQPAPKKIPELASALHDLQRRTEELATAIRAIPGLDLPASRNPFVAGSIAPLESRVQWLRWAGDLTDPGQTDPLRARLAQAIIAVLGSDEVVEPAALNRTADALDTFARACHVPPAAVEQWAGDAGVAAAWERTRHRRDLADDDLRSLRHWIRLIEALDPLRAGHLTELRELAVTGRLDVDDASRAFDLGLARASRTERLSTTGLEEFDADAHERSLDRFVTAARDVRSHLEFVVPHRALQARPFNPQAGGRVGQLTRELGRKRGGLKIRDLMAKYGDLITSALPCVLVSPDSVARFFPADSDRFDIVVFDEASQVRVADAIGAVGRAHAVIVVGDSEQMPPSSFGESTLPDDDIDTEQVDDDFVEDEESILTESVQARVPRHRLRWHYRSQDESLIAFSNHHHYDGDLESFPAPPTSDTGISLVRVDGHFHRSGKGALLKTNPVEAEAIVGEIRRRFAESPNRAPSIGVVTFNQQQRALIEGLLRDSGDPRLTEALEEKDGLFVKNLENVQGDERDVILFSTAFSVNDKGVLPLNFGPLNRSGGQRRLNVAVTRARRRVIVYSSFDPEQLRTEGTSSVGVRNLRTYLEMAARGAEALPARPGHRNMPDRHRDQIAEALRSRGIVVRSDVGLSGFKIDLALATKDEPDVPRVAVLLDGPAWAARQSTHDRYGLPREVLSTMLGWPAVEHVWLPSWLADPDAVLDRLKESLAGAETQPPAIIAPETRVEQDLTSLPTVPALRGVSPVLEPVAAAVTTSGTPGRLRSMIAPVDGEVATPAREEPTPLAPTFSPWEGHRLGDVSVLDALPSRWAAQVVTEAIHKIVAAEGPIHHDRLSRLVGTSFGLAKVVGRRRNAILHHMPSSLVVDNVESVVWPADVDPATWDGFRTTPDGVDRPLDHVPVREIVNAMVVVCRQAVGMEREELHRAALSVFGFRRLTTGFARRLDTAIEHGVRTGRLVVAEDDVITAAAR